MEKLRGKMIDLSKNKLFASVFIFTLILMFNILVDPRFFTVNTLYGNLSVITPIVAATMAQSIVILSGSIDLSIGASISLVNCILAVTLKDTTGSVVFGLAVSLAAMLGVSLLNGLLVAYFRLPAMVATFSVSTVLLGVTLLIMPVPGGYIPRWLPALYALRIGGIIPITIFILAALGVLWWFILQTRLGKYIYAAGGNEKSADASGIDAKRMKLYAFLLSGVFIWVCGIVVSGQTGAGDFRLGNPYTLTTVAAAIMGGISLSGGAGKMLGAALGGCIMILITNIIYFVGIPSFYQDMIRGLIVIIAMFITVIPKLKRRIA